MRDLTSLELNQVSGGCCDCSCPPPPPSCKTKNNNGYGNGPESGPPPGNSGDHNPQLTGILNGGLNLGPLGPR
ncbi:MAG: hypothetical protein JF593_02985 [Novosphingobium sp.]|nr:hypothetical protein [Novosphingobium sp.]